MPLISTRREPAHVSHQCRSLSRPLLAPWLVFCAYRRTPRSTYGLRTIRRRGTIMLHSDGRRHNPTRSRRDAPADLSIQPRRAEALPSLPRVYQRESYQPRCHQFRDAYLSVRLPPESRRLASPSRPVSRPFPAPMGETSRLLATRVPGARRASLSLTCPRRRPFRGLCTNAPRMVCQHVGTMRRIRRPGA